MTENLRLKDNVICFVKYLLKRKKMDTIEIFTEEDLNRIKDHFDKKGIQYTIDKVQNDVNLLEFEGVKVNSWDEAIQRINGTYEEPIDCLELIEGAVLELANILGEVLQND